MSEFVNYNKRSITLPDGCKNLTDLLGREASPEAPKSSRNAKRPFFSRNDTGALKFSGLKEHLQQVFQSKAKSADFRLYLAAHHVSISFSSHRLSPKALHKWSVTGSIIADDAPDLRLSVEKFYAKHSLKLPSDEDHNRPGRFTCRIVPLPADAKSCTKLLRAFLREVMGLNKESALIYWHIETSEAD